MGGFGRPYTVVCDKYQMATVVCDKYLMATVVCDKCQMATIVCLINDNPWCPGHQAGQGSFPVLQYLMFYTQQGNRTDNINKILCRKHGWVWKRKVNDFFLYKGFDKKNFKMSG